MIAHRNTLMMGQAGARAAARAAARAWAGARAWTWARARARAGAGARAWAAARAGAGGRAWAWAGGYCGFFDYSILASTWEQAIQGDEASWMAFHDILQELEEPEMWGLKVGQLVFIETPTFYYHGEIDEIGLTYLKLSPGAHEIRAINNLHVFLTDGKYSEDDEVTPMPGACRIPALSVVMVNDWVHKKMATLNKTDAEMRG